LKTVSIAAVPLRNSVGKVVGVLQALNSTHTDVACMLGQLDSAVLEDLSMATVMALERLKPSQYVF